MATTISDAERDRIFGRLETIFHGPESSGALTGDPFGEARSIAASTTDKEYFKLTGSANATSNSKLSLLNQCPRLYELEGLRAAQTMERESVAVNFDFAFGHAVGAGIQTYGATKNLVAAQFAAFVSWRAPYDEEKLDKHGKPTGKSLPMALTAVEYFPDFMARELGEYEMLRLPNGKPAVEVSFGVDTQNGFFHFGHIDAVLINTRTKQLAVWEGKTQGKAAQDADFGNSYQALGYSVVLDAVAKELNLPGQDYEVFYIVYNAADREFQLLPFTKSLAQRAEWLQDLLFQHATIQTYRKYEFFPKRGDQCVNKWGRTCHWFGQCQMRNESLFPGAVPVSIKSADQIKQLDFFFTLDQLVAAQKNRG